MLRSLSLAAPLSHRFIRSDTQWQFKKPRVTSRVLVKSDAPERPEMSTGVDAVFFRDNVLSSSSFQFHTPPPGRKSTVDDSATF